MSKFRATAKNAEGSRFTFFFHNDGWYHMDEVAADALATVVASDPLHQANGPWEVYQVEVAA